MDEKFSELVATCREIRAWHKTGILEGSRLRLRAYALEHKLGVNPGAAMQIAERNTADEAMDYLIHEIAGL